MYKWLIDIRPAQWLRAAVISCAGLAIAACGFAPVSDRPIERPLESVENQFWEDLVQQYPGDRFHLLNVGAEALDWRIRAIDSATDEIELQTFLWADDMVGRVLIRHLLRAADRGVRIRILLDDMFTVNERGMIAGLAAHPQVEFRIYNPYRLRPDSFVLRELLNVAQFSRANHRMHNKVMTVDSRIFIVGGRNLANEYFGFHDRSNFRDLEVVGFGPLGREVSNLFDTYWNSPWALDASEVIGSPEAAALQVLRRTLDDVPVFLKPEPAEERRAAWRKLVGQAKAGTVTILADAPAQKDPATDKPDQLARSMVSYLDNARSLIVIVSAYLVPTAELEAAIVRARARGVSVTILTNSLRSNNHTAAHSAYRKFIGALLGQGVVLHEVRAKAKDRGRYMEVPVESKALGLHAKTMLIDDDLSFVGSANLDPRSLQINTEVGLMIRSRELNQQIRDALALDFSTRNAWRLDESGGRVRWLGDDMVLDEQPAESAMQRIEDWFFGILPLQGQM